MYNVGERYLKCFFKLKNVTRIFLMQKGVHIDEYWLVTERGLNTVSKTITSIRDANTQGDSYVILFHTYAS